MGDPPAVPGRLPEFDSSGNAGKGGGRFGCLHRDGDDGKFLVNEGVELDNGSKSSVGDHGKEVMVIWNGDGGTFARRAKRL